MNAVLRALLGFTLFLSLVGSPREIVAAQDYCQYGTRANLIFVDRTTAYDQGDKDTFTKGFGKIFERLQTGDRVVVQTLGGSYADSRKSFDQCVPGCLEGGVIDWIFAKCKSLEARADLTKFKRELASQIRQMLDDIQDYPHSEIARTIAQVTSELSQGIAGANGRSLAFVFVFSDLIENSEALPWPRIIEPSPERASAELAERGVTAKLSGVQVYAFGFGRFHDKLRSPLDAETERMVRDFWTLFFRDGGASTVFIGRELD